MEKSWLLVDEPQTINSEVGLSLSSLKNLNIPCATKFKFHSFPDGSSESSSSTEHSPKQICDQQFLNSSSPVPSIKLLKDFKSKKSKKYSDDFVLMPEEIFNETKNEKKICRKLQELDLEDNKEIIWPLNLQGKSWRKNKYKNLIFDSKVRSEVFCNHLIKTYLALNKSQVYKAPNEDAIKKKAIEIKTFRSVKSLFFELENTLVKNLNNSEQADFFVEYYDNEGIFHKEFYKKRPYLKETLSVLRQFYEIYIFTKEIKALAFQIVNELDPDFKIFSDILCQKQTFQTKQSHFLKDLRIISNKDLKEMILIDSNTLSFSFQVDNGIPILPWEGDIHDRELKYLIRYLIKVNHFDDVRLMNQKCLKLVELAMRNKKDILEMIVELKYF